MKIILTLLTLALTFTACGGGKKEKQAQIEALQKELTTLQNDKEKIALKITETEAKLEKLDTTITDRKNAKLVRADTVYNGDFSHYIELQGKIDADNISYISPRGLGGQVQQIFVKKGDYIKVGTPILRLDDAIVRQNVVAAQKGLETIRVQQALAKTLYDRQKALWDQNIGAEIQVLQAKANVDALQTQLNAAQEGIKTAQEQLKTSMVYSNVAGYIDDINVRVGELFAGATGLGPQIKVINTSSLKATVNIPENYMNRITKGATVQVIVADLNRTINGNITFTSMNVDPNQRGFTADIKIPYDAALKPNQLAQIRILDYAANSAITVPINIVQSDENSKYLFIAEKSSNGTITAVKRNVQVGAFFGDMVEIKGGLKNADLIITQGYQNIYDGQLLKLTN